VPLLEALLAGTAQGLFYGLLAAGFAITFGVARTFNLAHGELVLLGAYAGLWLNASLGAGPLTAAAVAGPALALWAWPAQALLSRITPASELRVLTLTFGLSLLLQNLMLLSFSADYRFLDWGTGEVVWRPLGVSLGADRLTAAAAGAGLLLVLHLFLQRTRPGRALRATCQDARAAALMGIPVERMQLLGLALGGGLAGAAGPLLATLQYVSPTVGAPLTGIALTLTIAGGVGRADGLALAGVLFGIAESLVVALAGPGWREAWLFGALLLLLQGRQTGLLRGRRLS
jgi:branched-chain amino acid transport system permease protein